MKSINYKLLEKRFTVRHKTEDTKEIKQFLYFYSQWSVTLCLYNTSQSLVMTTLWEVLPNLVVSFDRI